METGFNFVEVPGARSRKVAGKKQQWYRTAILKIFIPSINVFYFSYFRNYVIAKFNVLNLELISDILIRKVKKINLIVPTDLKFMSVCSFKLQKTIRFFFIGNTSLLVKSYFSVLFNLRKNRYFLFGSMPVPESDKFKKQIKWLSI